MLRRPGVLVSTASVGATQPTELTPYTYMPVGYAPWGPINRPTPIGNLTDAVRLFGSDAGLSGYQLPLALRHYFDVAGSTGRALVTRAFNLNNQPLSNYIAKAIVKDTSGNDLLIVEAAHPGALGNQFHVNIAPGRTGMPNEYLFILWSHLGPETFYWLASATPEAEAQNRAVIAKFNELADQLGSNFRLRLPEVSGAPTYNTNPPAAASVSTASPVRPDRSKGFAFTGGADSPAMTAGAVVGGVDPVLGHTGLKALEDTSFGPGFVDIYGFAGVEALAAVDDHASRYQRLALRQITAAGVTNIVNVLAEKTAIGGSSYSADYWPWIYDLSGRIAPITPLVAGLAARKISRLDREGGLKASITGELAISRIESSLGREVVTNQVAELLFANQINYVQKGRRGYRLQAQRLSAPEGQTATINERVTLNAFSYGIEELMEQFRDRIVTATGVTEQEVVSAIREYLAPYEAGKPAPQGDTIFGVSVVTSRTLTEDLQQRQIRFEVGVALSPHAEKVIVGITHLPIA